MNNDVPSLEPVRPTAAPAPHGLLLVTSADNGEMARESDRI